MALIVDFVENNPAVLFDLLTFLMLHLACDCCESSLNYLLFECILIYTVCCANTNLYSSFVSIAIDKQKHHVLFTEEAGICKEFTKRRTYSISLQ